MRRCGAPRRGARRDTRAAMGTVDWSALFTFSVPPLELVVRGSAVYWFLFLVFRFVMRRDIGAVGLADVLLIVLVADASQNAMAGSHTSIVDGLLLVSTLLGWNYLMDRLSYHFPQVRRFTEPRPLLLIRDGRVQRHNLRREFVTPEELQAHLRDNGLISPAQVRAAFMESDGRITVIATDGARLGRRPQRPF